jgi:FkbM family methyltransferase
MKEYLRYLISFCHNFGLVKGLILFYKFKASKVDNIKLPNIKFPFSLREGTSDINTFYQIFLYNEYNISILQNPKVIIDAGANIGLFAIKIKNAYPSSKVICIEPDAENFHQLQKNTQNYNDIFCENYGLWNKDTQLKVYDKYNLGKWGMCVEETLTGGNVSAISLNSLIKKHKIDTIDLLKIDIETSEKYLFSSNYEEWLPKVKTIIIETHDRIEEGCSKPFFMAINKSINNYAFDISGENIVILNLDFKNK